MRSKHYATIIGAVAVLGSILGAAVTIGRQTEAVNQPVTATEQRLEAHDAVIDRIDAKLDKLTADLAYIRRVIARLDEGAAHGVLGVNGTGGCRTR